MYNQDGEVIIGLESQKQYFNDSDEAFRAYFIANTDLNDPEQIKNAEQYLYPTNPYGLEKTLKETLDTATKQASGVLQEISTQTDQQDEKKFKSDFVSSVMTAATENVSKNIALSGLIKSATDSTQTLLQELPVDFTDEDMQRMIDRIERIPSTTSQKHSALEEFKGYIDQNTNIFIDSINGKKKRMTPEALALLDEKLVRYETRLTEQLLDTTNNQVESVLNAIKDTIEKEQEPKDFTGKMMENMIKEYEQLFAFPSEKREFLKNIKKETDSNTNIWFDPNQEKLRMTPDALALLDEKIVHYETLLLLDTASKQVDSVLSTIKDTIEKKEQQQQQQQLQLQQQQQEQLQQEQRQKEQEQQQQTLTEQLLTSANDHVGSVLSTIQKTVEEEKQEKEQQKLQQDLTEQLLTSANSQVGSVLSTIQKTVEEEQLKQLEQHKLEQLQAYQKTQELFSSAQKQAEELRKRLQLEEKIKKVEMLKKIFNKSEEEIEADLAENPAVFNYIKGDYEQIILDQQTFQDAGKLRVLGDLPKLHSQFKEKLKLIQEGKTQESQIDDIIQIINNLTADINKQGAYTLVIQQQKGKNKRKEEPTASNRITAADKLINERKLQDNQKVKEAINTFLLAAFTDVYNRAATEIEDVMNSDSIGKTTKMQNVEKEIQTKSNTLQTIFNQTNNFTVIKKMKKVINPAQQIYTNKLEAIKDIIQQRRQKILEKINSSCSKKKNEVDEKINKLLLEVDTGDSKVDEKLKNAIHTYANNCYVKIDEFNAKQQKLRESQQRQVEIAKLHKNRAKTQQEVEQQKQKDTDKKAAAREVRDAKAAKSIVRRNQAADEEQNTKEEEKVTAKQIKQSVQPDTSMTDTPFYDNNPYTKSMNNQITEAETKIKNLVQTNPNYATEKVKLEAYIKGLKQSVGVNYLVMDLGKFIYNVHDKLITLDTLNTKTFANNRSYGNYLKVIPIESIKTASKKFAVEIIEYAKKQNITLFNENKDVGSKLKKQVDPDIDDKVQELINKTKVIPKHIVKQRQQQVDNLIQLLNSSQTTATGIVEMLNSLEQERKKKEEQDKKAEEQRKKKEEEDKNKEEDINKKITDKYTKEVQQIIQPVIYLYDQCEKFYTFKKGETFIDNDFMKKFENYFYLKTYSKPLTDFKEHDIESILSKFEKDSNTLNNYIESMIGVYGTNQKTKAFEMLIKHKPDNIISIITGKFFNDKLLNDKISFIHEISPSNLTDLNTNINFFDGGKLNEKSLKQFCNGKIIVLTQYISEIQYYKLRSGNVTRSGGSKMRYVFTTDFSEEKEYGEFLGVPYNTYTLDVFNGYTEDTQLDKLLKCAYICLVYAQACKLLFYKLSHCSQINYQSVEKVKTDKSFEDYVGYQEVIKTNTTALLKSIDEGIDDDISNKYKDFIQVVTDIRNIYHPIANNKVGK